MPPLPTSHLCLVLVIAAVLLPGTAHAQGVEYGPIADCPDNVAGNFFVADRFYRCIYYWCAGGTFVDAGRYFSCPSGTAVPAGHFSADAACSLHEPRCAAGPPGPIPGADNSTMPEPVPAPGPQPGPAPMPRPRPMPGPMPRPVPRPAPGPQPGPQPGPMPRPQPRPQPRPMPGPMPRPMSGPMPGTMVTPPPTTTQPPSGYYVFNHYHISGGLQLFGDYNIFDCIAACRGACRGVDYDFRDASCWVHTDATECRASLMPKQQCMHVRVNTQC